MADEFMTIGTTGLKQSGGFIDTEWHLRLKADQKFRVYTEMRDNDPIIGAMFYTAENILRNVEWSVVPSKDVPEAEAKAAAEFLEDALHDMAHTWEDFISEVLSFLQFGWAYFETVYKKRDDGLVGWHKISIRGQETRLSWEIDDDGEILGMWQSDPYGGKSNVFLPMNKCLLFRTTTKRNDPEGRSILRNAYRPWYFLKRIQEFEAIGVERDLAGLPVFKVPPKIMQTNASPAEKALRRQLEDLVSQVRRDEHGGLVVPNSVDEKGEPTGYDFGLLASAGRRQLPTDTIIKRYETRIAMTALADFVLLGSDKVGSYALASTKTKLYSMALAAYLRHIESVLNRYAVPRLFELNPKFRPEAWPTLAHGDIEDQPLEELARFVKETVGVGALVPTESIDEPLREVANMPPRGEDDETLLEMRPSESGTSVQPESVEE